VNRAGRTARTHRALALGEYAGIGPWSGRVVSAHAGALNVVRDDGLLVSVVAAEGSMTAMSILAASVFEPPRLTGGDLPILTGRPAELQRARLLISGLAPIELPRGKTWHGRVRSDVAKAVWAEKALLAERALARGGRSGGLLGVLFGGASRSPYEEQALRALAAGRPESLVGLGPGMTPAGDDFLAGALLAGSAGFVHGLSGTGIDARAIEAALSRTTPAGRTLLWLALRGSFPSYLCSFIERLAEATAEQGIEKAVCAACFHGETSGTDSLTGFFLTIRGQLGSIA
jgi:hypothetical protein